MESLKSKIKYHNELSEKLTPENNQIYTDIVLYLRLSKLSEIDAEDAIGDILEMLIDAQERNQNARDIFGEDIKEFCENIINSYGYNKNSKLKYFFQIASMCIIFTTIYNYVFEELPNIIKGNQSWFTLNYSLSMLINTIVVTVFSYLLLTYIGKPTFKKDNYTKKGKFIEFLRYWLTSIILLGTLVVFNLFFKNTILFETNVYIVILILILIYIIQYIMNLKMKN